jgi:hypothetical protein
MINCEILFHDIPARATRMFDALIQAASEAGINPIVTDRWSKKTDLLMSYGLGHPQRRLWTEAHVAAGGRLIGWDLSYWDRDNAMRCTVDHLHPWRLIRDMPGERWKVANIPLRDDGNPSGHIVLVGMGRKSRAQFAMQDRAWEKSALASIRKIYPQKEIVYKPKRPEDAIKGCRTMDGPIQDALLGASLVVCRHSNVAVDSCIAGVPVVCEDGAAAALYGSDLANPTVPDRESRLRFLRNLAWWQYRPDEAALAWKFLTGVIYGGAI